MVIDGWGVTVGGVLFSDRICLVIRGSLLVHRSNNQISLSSDPIFANAVIARSMSLSEWAADI